MQLIAHMHVMQLQTKMQRVQSWVSKLLEKVNGSEAEYRVVSCLIQSDGRRSLMGPFPRVELLPDGITVSLSAY